MAKFCSECGTALLTETAKFCHECGSSVNPAEGRPGESGGQRITFNREVSDGNLVIAARDANVGSQHFEKNPQTTTNSHNVADSHNIADSYNTTITITDAFKGIYDYIEENESDYLPEQQAEYVSYVEAIEEEAARGEQANGNKIKGWLGKLANMAPDIFDVAVSTMINPVLGIAEAVRKIAVKAQEEYGSRG